MSFAAHARRPLAPPSLDPPGYGRHRPEASLLYQLVQQHYPAFRELRGKAGRRLPEFVQEEFEVYLKCGPLEEGFLRVRCEQCHAEKLVAFDLSPDFEVDLELDQSGFGSPPQPAQGGPRRRGR